MEFIFHLWWIAKAWIRWKIYGSQLSDLAVRLEEIDKQHSAEIGKFDAELRSATRCAHQSFRRWPLDEAPTDSVSIAADQAPQCRPLRISVTPIAGRQMSMHQIMRYRERLTMKYHSGSTRADSVDS